MSTDKMKYQLVKMDTVEIRVSHFSHTPYAPTNYHYPKPIPIAA